MKKVWIIGALSLALLGTAAGASAAGVWNCSSADSTLSGREEANRPPLSCAQAAQTRPSEAARAAHSSFFNARTPFFAAAAGGPAACAFLKYSTPARK